MFAYPQSIHADKAGMLLQSNWNCAFSLTALISGKKWPRGPDGSHPVYISKNYKVWLFPLDLGGWNPLCWILKGAKVLNCLLGLPSYSFPQSLVLFFLCSADLYFLMKSWMASDRLDR